MAIVGHRRPWGSYSCRVVRCRCLFAPMLGFPCLLLLWPVCAFGRLGRLAVSLFLVKGSARDLVSNDSVGPCWLKNCSAFKFGTSSNLDIDLTCEVCKQKPNTAGHTVTTAHLRHPTYIVGVVAERRVTPAELRRLSSRSTWWKLFKDK